MPQPVYVYRNPATMNKHQLIEAVALEAGISKEAARKSIEAFVHATTRTLQEGDKLLLSGLGTFSVTQRPARLGRNPRTGAPVKIAARRVVKFRPTLDLD